MLLIRGCALFFQDLCITFLRFFPPDEPPFLVMLSSRHFYWLSRACAVLVYLLQTVPLQQRESRCICLGWFCFVDGFRTRMHSLRDSSRLYVTWELIFIHKTSHWADFLITFWPVMKQSEPKFYIGCHLERYISYSLYPPRLKLRYT